MQETVCFKKYWRNFLRTNDVNLIRFIYKYLTRRNRIYYKRVFFDWDRAIQLTSGYDDDEILNKVLSSTLKVTHDEGYFERDSVLFRSNSEIDSTTSILLSVAEKHKNQLNVLDFGGSLGSVYFKNKDYLRDLENLHWAVVEQSHFVNTGKKYIENNVIKFFNSLQDAFLGDNQYQILLLSSVLQFIRDPYELLKELISLDIEYILIERTPIIQTDSDQLTIQYIPPSIYSATYPAWFLSEQKILSQFSSKYEIVETFISDDEPLIILPFKMRYKGYLLRRIL